jgi:hypothetical protein
MRYRESYFVGNRPAAISGYNIAHQLFGLPIYDQLTLQFLTENFY